MNNKQRFFIYGRKEMIVLIILCITVMAFAFTMGVHLGKQVGITGPTANLHRGSDPFPVETVQDAVPGRVELAEQMKGAVEAAEDSLGQSLHDEVTRTGIQLDVKRQTELPEKPKAKNAGATTLKKPASQTEEVPIAKNHSDRNHIDTNTKRGKYAIQVGSFPSKEEAEKHLHQLKVEGLETFVKPVDLKEKGKWFRVYFGGFESKKEAEQAANKYKDEKKIDSFVVSNMPD